jgi:hypothetical protein
MLSSLTVGAWARRGLEKNSQARARGNMILFGEHKPEWRLKREDSDDRCPNNNRDHRP